PDAGIGQSGAVPSDNRVADIEVADIQPSRAAAIRAGRGRGHREALIGRESGDVGVSQAGRSRQRVGPIRKDKALVWVSRRVVAGGEAEDAAGDVADAPGDGAVVAAGGVATAPRNGADVAAGDVAATPGDSACDATRSVAVPPTIGRR